MLYQYIKLRFSHCFENYKSSVTKTTISCELNVRLLKNFVVYHLKVHIYYIRIYVYIMLATRKNYINLSIMAPFNSHLKNV